MNIFFMTINPEHRTQNTLILMGLSFVMVLASFLVYRGFSIDFVDESFLWYGMIHTAMGEVPIRDFQAYDPGRYYWGALWFKILNTDDPNAFRAVLAICEWGGLTFAMLCLKRITKSWSFLIFYALLIHAWMYVHYKSFDIIVAVAAIYLAVLLLEKPSLSRHFSVGVFVGFSAFIGINHGLYTGLSFFFLILFIWLKLSHDQLLKRFLVWGLGGMVGFSPVILMGAIIPGFLEAYYDRIVSITKSGSTNLHIPVPWPWSVNYLDLSVLESLKAVSVGLYFLVFPVFTLIMLSYLIFSRSSIFPRQFVLIAASFVGLTYMHYAFARADLPHLSFAVSPLLIGMMAFPSSINITAKAARSVSKISLLSFIFITTLFCVGNRTPWNKARVLMQASLGLSPNYVQATVKGVSLWWSKQDAALILMARHLGSQVIGENESVFIAPSPGLYAFMERKSPTKKLYFLSAEPLERQEAIINELEQKGTNWAFVSPDVAIDGRDELRFRNAFALVWKYLTENFEVVDDAHIPAGAGQLMHRRQESMIES